MSICSSSSSHPNSRVATGKLVCYCTLAPPAKQIVEGDAALVYLEQQPAWQCTFSRDGNYLAVGYGGPDASVRIWRHGTATPHRDSSTCGPNNNNNNNEATTAATTITTNEWILHATLTGIQQRSIRSVAFAPISEPLTLAAASFDGTIAIWELARSNDTWECVAQLEGHDNEVKCVAWNATGSLLATCGRDKTVWLWECFLPGTIGGAEANQGGEFECLSVLHGHQGDVKCVGFVASHGQWGDGDEILLSASYDDTIKVWAEEAGDWFCAASLEGVHSNTIWSLAPAPSGVRLVSGSADGSLAIYKSYSATEKNNERFPNQTGRRSKASWQCVGTLPNAHARAIYSVDYASARCGHGRIASGGADHCIHVYREAMKSTTDQPQFLLEASAVTQHGDVNCVCWHPFDGSVLASAGDDGTVQLWRFSPQL